MSNDNTPLRDCAWFKTELPDDTEWNDKGDPVVPAGRAVTTRLQQILRFAGINTNAPEQHSYYAWKVEAKRDNVEVECLVQALEPWILLTIPHGGLFSRKSKRQLHIDVIAALANGMNVANGFPEVGWATRDELADQGKFKR